MKPQRIQLSRRKGWRMPENTVKVDRTNRTFGNPFRIGGYFRIGDINPKAAFRMDWMERCIWKPEDIDDALATGFTLIEDAATAVDFYRRLCATGTPSANMLENLRGKNLACWCKPGDPCHADVLLELANRPGARKEEG